MIIGNGLLAQAFAPEFSAHPQVVVFASGVSNSKETRPEQYARERSLLEATLAQHRFMVYFSSCSVHDTEMADTPYVRHKLAMEALIAERAEQRAIFRLPQVVGATPNPFTLTNYLFRQINQGLPFQVWSRARRNLIDVADVAGIVGHLVRSHQADGLVTNVACPFSVPVAELVQIFENVLDRRAVCDSVDAGGSYTLDVAAAMAAAAEAGIAFGPDYVPRLIKKYYGEKTHA